MSCSLSAIAFCLSRLYLDGSLSALDSGVEQYGRDSSSIVVVDRSGWPQASSYRQQIWYSHRAQNPYGRLAVGYEQTFFVPNLRLSAELYHESSLATASDRGVNGARISLRWYPFGGAQ